MVNPRFTETKVFPSPFTLEVTKTTFPFFFPTIKFILVIKILSDSARGDMSFIFTNSLSPFSSCGTSPIIGIVFEIFSISCFDLILLSNNSNK